MISQLSEDSNSPEVNKPATQAEITPSKVTSADVFTSNFKELPSIPIELVVTTNNSERTQFSVDSNSVRANAEKLPRNPTTKSFTSTDKKLEISNQTPLVNSQPEKIIKKETDSSTISESKISKNELEPKSNVDSHESNNANSVTVSGKESKFYQSHEKKNKSAEQSNSMIVASTESTTKEKFESSNQNSIPSPRKEQSKEKNEVSSTMNVQTNDPHLIFVPDAPKTPCGLKATDSNVTKSEIKVNSQQSKTLIKEIDTQKSNSNTVSGTRALLSSEASSQQTSDERPRRANEHKSKLEVLSSKVVLSQSKESIQLPKSSLENKVEPSETSQNVKFDAKSPHLETKPLPISTVASMSISDDQSIYGKKTTPNTNNGLETKSNLQLSREK